MLMFLTDVQALGLKVSEGPNFTETFYWDMNDQTWAFSKRFMDSDKKCPPTMVQAGVDSTLIHYFKALEALAAIRMTAASSSRRSRKCRPTIPCSARARPRLRPQDPPGLSLRGEEPSELQYLSTLYKRWRRSRRRKPSCRWK